MKELFCGLWSRGLSSFSGRVNVIPIVNVGKRARKRCRMVDEDLIIFRSSSTKNPFQNKFNIRFFNCSTKINQIRSENNQLQSELKETYNLNQLRQLIKSGTPQDLSHLSQSIDNILINANNNHNNQKSIPNESIKEILNDTQIWSSYIQSLIQIPNNDQTQSIGQLSKLIQDRYQQRQTLLDSLSNTSEPIITQKDHPLDRLLASVNLTRSALISSIFNRFSTRANVINQVHPNELHAANQQAIAATSSNTNQTSRNANSDNHNNNSNSDSVGTIKVVVEEFKGNWAIRSLKFLGVTLVYSFIMLTLLSLVMDSSGLLKATAPTGGPTEFKPQSQKPVTFEDVHGCDEAKEELKEVVDFLKDPLKFARLGGRLPRGVLLTGPPGTGKTLLARAVAGEAGVQFFIASGSEFDEMYVGVGARRIRELFAAARKSAPAIIFIDELDAIGGKRSPKDQHYIKQTLNQLLVELDGFQQSEGVILMAATNFPSSLDKALTRPGRFDRHVAVPLPDARGRIQILKHHAQNVTVDPDLDLSFVARSTPGFSGADLQNLVNQAAVKASREGAQSVTARHFDWARDRIMMGAENKSYITTPQQKRLTAYHEAGHALVSMYTPGATPLHKVTCLRRGHALGITHFLPEMDKVSESYRECLARLDVGMGGRAAEELLMGKEHITSGASSDIDNATLIATAMIREMGFSTKLGPRAYRNDDQLSPQTLAIIDLEVLEMVEAAEKRARELLREKRVELDRLAHALVEFETLSAEEAWAVVKGLPIQRDTV
ncbi:hypothetical protein CROQUDRAFT_658174 [Cronartium quercuum f. sp. fusiforme G11]|uniref:AAA+ ATPase domain-containing protein n=1 Tax=Cronartium quercuum f. sp. fusiforme G11 TaxID=708437 RepID=A0A9P6TB14_9BASI|nr:hypothetical protein CROQUDRAFT_658174 [Cronartium quercuum f. sp. fusiforme G11]